MIKKIHQNAKHYVHIALIFLTIFNLICKTVAASYNTSNVKFHMK